MPKTITEMITDFFQALAHPTRIEILELLESKDKMCVCEMVEKLKKDQSNISRHLNALKETGIVEFQAEGARSNYRVKNKDVYRVFELVKSILHKDIRESQKILAAF